MAIDETAGVTPSERYLGRLCKKSFLTLWSCPNPTRDQKRPNGKGDGKELCDLLVICGDDIIIFSDKSCAYPNTGKPQIDWERWYRKSVHKSAEQVFGAERWLKRFPEKIFLDRACTKPLSIEIPKGPQVRYHRVVIALNAGKSCRDKYPAGSGSLLLCSLLKGEAAHTKPFVIGQVAPEKGFVHVFDDVTLDVLMKTLDTITDFVRYLNAKEKLVLEHGVTAFGEEDLLAFFLFNGNETGKHYFPLPGPNEHPVIQEGGWAEFRAHPQFIAKQIADKSSYLWDAIIEEFTRHLLNGTLLGGVADIKRTELGLRCMAQETRFARRFYADSLLEVRAKTGLGEERKRSLTSIILPSTAYVFLIANWDGKDVATYRKWRQRNLENYCFVYAYVHREIKRVIGIATESNSKHGESHDILYSEFDAWTPEMEKFANELQTLRGWLRPGKVQQTHRVDCEYPPLSIPTKPIMSQFNHGRIGRNDPCPCGSGRKYKTCCMRGS